MVVRFSVIWFLVVRNVCEEIGMCIFGFGMVDIDIVCEILSVVMKVWLYLMFWYWYVIFFIIDDMV